jgi:hypothetical protein
MLQDLQILDSFRNLSLHKIYCHIPDEFRI